MWVLAVLLALLWVLALAERQHADKRVPSSDSTIDQVADGVEKGR